MINSSSSENLIKTKNSNFQHSTKILNSEGNLGSDSTNHPIKDDEFTLNRNNNDFVEILDNINIKESTNIEFSMNNLEKKLEQKLFNIKQENEKNKILNLTKNYCVYKDVFEETIKTVHQFNNIKSNKLLNKILTGYNETVQTLFLNFSKLYEKYTEGETVYNSK